MRQHQWLHTPRLQWLHTLLPLWPAEGCPSFPRLMDGCSQRLLCGNCLHICEYLLSSSHCDVRCFSGSMLFWLVFDGTINEGNAYSVRPSEIVSKKALTS